MKNRYCMDGNFVEGEGFISRFRRKHLPKIIKKMQQNYRHDYFKDVSMLPSFEEWYKSRVNEDMDQQSGVNADTPGQVTAPTDPKEIQRRKAVSDITSNLMKKNPRLKPGMTDNQTVANISTQDAGLQKSDPETQQAVSSFFLKK